VIEASVRAAGPYSLRVSTWREELVTPLPGGGEGRAWQRRDGSLLLRAPDEAGIELLRFVLALDADTTEFVRRFRRDPLLGPTVLALPGLRPPRLPTVAQAVVRAFCGQLIEAKRARALERRIVRRCGEAAPSREAVAALAPAELRRLGLAQSRATCLVRVCRRLDLERLRTLPLEAVERRLLREPGLGPWSLGTIALNGLGSYRYALTGDLSFVKLLSSLEGRWVEPHETARLFEPYGEWAGLASVYLLRGWTRGLVPGADPDRARAVRAAAGAAA
jgi:3-methyladenine DNA glycosylase/8-oxoguanine DNA glycosylase